MSRAVRGPLLFGRAGLARPPAATGGRAFFLCNFVIYCSHESGAPLTVKRTMPDALLVRPDAHRAGLFFADNTQFCKSIIRKQMRSSNVFIDCGKLPAS